MCVSFIMQTKYCDIQRDFTIYCIHYFHTLFTLFIMYIIIFVVYFYFVKEKTYSYSYFVFLTDEKDLIFEISVTYLFLE